MKLLDELMNKKAELQIAPLIDVVFLLLIYFMVTSSLVKKEADLSFMLPAAANPQEAVTLPIEVVIEISDVGDVTMNGMVFGQDSRNLNDLAGQLRALKQAADSSGSQFIVTIMPDDRALQSRIVNVMDACAAAHVKNMSFAMSM